MAVHRGGVAVAIGCRVRIRSVRERRSVRGLPAIEPDDAERVVTIVPSGQMGLYKLSPRTPLGGALLGHQAGDVVPVSVEAGTVGFEILAVDPVPSTGSRRRAAGSGGWRVAMAGSSALSATHASEELTRRQLVRATVSSTLGSAIEWYDFNLYSITAGLYLGRLFFPSSKPFLSELLGFATLLAGYVIRPAGAAFFGHLGDRIGRKSTLIMTLLLMGTTTFLVGLVPTYSEVGIYGSGALILLRMVQGFGVGGEWGGSVLLTVEWGNRTSRRGFLGSFPMAGAPAGLVMAYGSLHLFTTLLGPGSYWAWRIPFLLSIVLVLVGLYIRLGILETPVFAALLEERKIEDTPSLGVLRFNYREILICLLLRAGEVGPAILFQTFILTYATGVLGFRQSDVLTDVLVAAAVAIGAVPTFGGISDWIGRKRMYLIGAVTMALFALPYWALIDSRVPWVVGIAIVASFIVQNMQTGPEAALLAESFTGRRRYSGTSLGYHLGAALWGGTAPIVALTLFSAFRDSTPIALYMIGLAAISAVAVAMLPDRSRQDLSVEYDLPGSRYRGP